MKTCSGDWRNCQHACQSSSAYIYCQYEGFCVYQLPREIVRTKTNEQTYIAYFLADGTRVIGIPKNPQDPIPEQESELCECGKLYRWVSNGKCLNCGLPRKRKKKLKKIKNLPPDVRQCQILEDKINEIIAKINEEV